MREAWVSGLEPLRRHPGLEALGIIRLQHQGRDDRGEVGVAAALAEPVQGALDLADAGAHGGERIGDAIVGVVMDVDAEMIAGDVLDHLADDRLDLLGQRAAIGVAQHDPAGAGLVGRLGAVDGVIGIGLVAVEEMLAVEQRLAPARDHGGHGLADALQVLLERDAERNVDVEIPGLGDEADGAGLRREHRLEAGIVGDRPPRPLGHAEGGERRRLHRPRLGEQLGVGGIGAGITGLDIVEPSPSSCSAISALSSSEKSTPWVWAPSRSVVS